MNKIGLCICYNHKNFGSLLQAYATYSFLLSRTENFEIVRYRKKITIATFFRWLPRLFNQYLIEDKIKLIQKTISRKINPVYNSNCRVRDRYFEDFINEKFIKLSPLYNGFKELQVASATYKMLISGSDQLWSPSGLPTNFYNLNWSDSEKKMSYAASFGTSKIPFYQKNRTKKFLNKYKYISVREIAGRKIIKKLTGRDVKVVVDPTLLLTKEDWDNEFKDRRLVKEQYLFAYFLGRNKKYRQEVRKLAIEKKLKLVVLRHLDEYIPEDEDFGDIFMYDTGPSEFYNLIKHASFVCTDSFHGTVFSILNSREFCSFYRYKKNAIVSKNSRIDSLCENLDLKNRIFSDNLNNIYEQKINYNAVNKRLYAWRIKSIEYFNNALDGGVNDR